MTFTFERIPLIEAIAFFQEKINIPTGSWSDLEEIEHTVAFTVAGMKAEILADARAILDKLIIEGTSIDEARASFNQLIARTGWLEDKTTKQKAWRVETIIDTNLKTSNAIGRWQYQNDPDVVDATPYFLYRHGDSVVPRPAHLALDGAVYRRDDPRAADLYTPRGFRCSCLNFVISKREYEAKYKGKAKDFVESGVPDTVKVGNKNLSTDADTGFKLSPNMPSDERRAEIVARMAERLPTDINQVFLDEVGKIGDRYPEQFDNQPREPKGSPKGGQFAKKQGSGIGDQIIATLPRTAQRKISRLNEQIKIYQEAIDYQGTLKDLFQKNPPKAGEESARAEALGNIEGVIQRNTAIIGQLKGQISTEIERAKSVTDEPTTPKERKPTKSAVVIPDLPEEGSVNVITDKRTARKMITGALKESNTDYFREDLTDKQREDIDDNASIWGYLNQASGNSEYRVIQNSKGIQAATLFDEEDDHLYINYLATASHNLKGFENDKTTRGQASLAVAEVAKESIKRGKGGAIELYALDGARPFYEKIGFEPIQGTEGSYRMSAEKAKALIEKTKKDTKIIQLSQDEDDELWELEQAAAGAFSISESDIKRWNSHKVNNFILISTLSEP